ncbi:hypothetical protein DSD19_14025 [Rhodovulum sp. BSW8]|uniref:Uncharacterized protein n=1 Tax=Rhodovulum visakhapatnamense TaxID=364297 RepID=A0A4R8FH26_9RHOB|nr:hypothetical protein [Rhodovulum]RBO52567.1 hypothetical protein DSD19_14025 [Rhodovulum sp. BSW8]TDX22177.1 hypothetical protein EV657_13211 [Rhodovulum visakhapatnamense]
MPLPLAPIATVALRYGLRYGAVALAAYALSKSRDGLRRDQRTEDAMDELGEGLTFRRDQEQVNGAARMRRTFRMGTAGPGVEIDASAFGRLRVRRV